MNDLVGILIFGLVWAIPLWIICGKVGLPPVLSLASFIPWVGVLIVLGVLANVTWPKARRRGN